ncbi:DUF892 family protein [Gemmata sp.]|uniref:DUF892 family protein n=1 Tax=Gemmata sp. TaxID=1914242 RepID=UPI003F724A0F
MPDETDTPPEPVAAERPAPAASRRTRSKQPTGAVKRRTRATPKKQAEALRKELAAVRQELDGARRETAEVVAACRDAEARVAATRGDADAIRRAVAEVDTAAAASRGLADAAAAEVRRLQDQFAQTEARADGLRATLQATRDEFAALGAESRRTLDQFRAAVDEMRGVPPSDGGEIAPDGGLPDVPPLAADERAGDLRARLVHALNDAWGLEKEQVGLLQTLADESGDHDVRTLLEDHRAAARRRQEAAEARLGALGARPASGRGLLGQLAARVWDAVQAPRDPVDRAVLALTKAAGAAEFAAGVYAAAHALARSAGDAETAELAAAHFADGRDRANRLRAAIAAAAVRAARR